MKGVVWTVVVALLVVVLLPALGDAHNSDMLSGSVRAGSTIRINGDSELVAMASAYNWSGNGTSSDPYIISGYSIDAHGAGAAFYVGNTTLYFVIENSYFHNATYGVHLYHVQHAILLNNNISNNSKIGVFVDSSHNVSMYSNELYRDGIYIKGTKAVFAEQDIPSNNTVNGKPVYYYYGKYNINVSASAGEVIIADSQKVSISSLNISSSTLGVEVVYSSDVTISDSIIEHVSLNAVYVYQSSGVVVKTSRISYSESNGVYLSYVSDSTVINNTLDHEQSAGVGLYYASNNLIKSNRYYGNGMGLALYYSDNNTLENGVVDSSAGDGVYLSYSDYNFMMGYSVKGSVHAIHVYNSRHNIFYSNALLDDGFYLDGEFSVPSQDIASNNTVNGAPVLYYVDQDLSGVSIPTGAGQIIFAGVKNALVSGEDISNITQAIYVWHSENITVTGSRFTHVGTAVEIEGSSNIFVEKDYFYSGDTAVYILSSSFVNVVDSMMYNESTGVNMAMSKLNLINNNTFQVNGVGMMLNGSWNVVERNMVSSSGYYGILLIGAYYNVIRSNNITHSLLYGIMVQSGSYNVIYNNTFEFNDKSGGTYNSSCVQAADMDVDNMWNTSYYGNYWYDWANNNSTNADNGIVKWPYVIDSEGGNVMDYRPLKNPSTAKIFVPSAPTSLSAQSGTSYVLLSWNAPIDDGGSPISGYIVYRNGVPLAHVGADVHSYKDTDVTPGQSYVYYVKAVNSVGTGFRSNSIEAVPGGEVPEFSSLSLLFIVVLVGTVSLLRRK